MNKDRDLDYLDFGDDSDNELVDRLGKNLDPSDCDVWHDRIR